MLIFYNLKTIYLYCKSLNEYILTSMPLRILFVAATVAEAEILNMLPGIKSTPEGISFGSHEISSLVTGVGSIATAWAMTKKLSSGFKPDLAINAGIAGSFRDDLPAGEVVVPSSDCFADAGIDTGKGFLTLAEAGLEDPDRFPFRGGRIIVENKYFKKATGLLEPVRAITVNTSTGSSDAIERLVSKYNPDIETMEGATFFYICSREEIPFLALRAISNRVEPRNREKWDIRLALNNLQNQLKEVLLLFE
jgi:futalosine hydrolase